MDSSRAIEANPIIGAPKQVEYRNKCELTFGYRHTVSGEDGKTIIKAPAVGFMAGGWSGGVSNPHCLPNIPDEVCGIADIVNEFLSSSPLPPYDSKSHRGVWRQLTMRLSKRTDECMLIITHAPASGGAGKKDDGSDDYTEQFKTEKDRLIKMLTETNIPSPVRDLPMKTSEGNTAKEEEMSTPNSKNVSKVTSLFFQSYDGLSSPAPDHPCQVSLFPIYLSSCRAYPLSLIMSYFCCNIIEACFWQVLFGRKIRSVYFSNFPRSIFPGNYGGC